MAKISENLLMSFAVLKPVALTNKEECCSAPKMPSVASLKCLVTWTLITKEKTTYFKSTVHYNLSGVKDSAS